MAAEPRLVPGVNGLATTLAVVEVDGLVGVLRAALEGSAEAKTPLEAAKAAEPLLRAIIRARNELASATAETRLAPTQA